MPKYYLDLPVLDRTDPNASYRLNSDEIMAVTGQNIGNFAFRHALRYIVKDLSSYEICRYPAYLTAARAGKVESSIVSCANWLGMSDQDERSNLNRAVTFEATDASTVCFAIGVQAKGGTKVAELRENTVRLAKALAARAKYLSVRDEVTQQTLAHFGIKNTVITGCPSNFINGDPELGKKVAQKAQTLLDNVQTWRDLKSLICEFSGGNTASGQVLSTKMRFLEQTPAHYVLQAPTLLPFTLRETNEIPAVYRSNHPFGDDNKRLEMTLRSKCIHFSSIESWMDYARTCDLSFGMRIHGNMIPLQAGVPSALISHDSRTAGLADMMGIPHISAEDFAGGYSKTPHKMLEVIVEKMSVYDAHRKKLANIMTDYVTANGLDAHPSLLGLAGRANA